MDKFLTGSAVSAVAVSMLYSAPAMAAGTLAGTAITNNVSVSYQVSGNNQTDATASNSFAVDRKVDLTVARTDNTATQVAPGSVNQSVEFQVTNNSNDTLDFDLSAAQVATGGAAGISGDANDSFNVGALTFYLDNNGNGVIDGADAVITHLDALAPDTSAKVLVVAATVPTGLSTNQDASIILTATAHANDGAATLGAALTQSATNDPDPNHVDTIFADGAGSTDGSRDAAYSAEDDYKVFAAAITATKSSKVVSGDFGTGAAIPGAKVEYCIAVANAAGGAAASNLVISDTLPSQVTYDGTYGVKVGGADCSTPGGGSGSQSGGVVSGTIASLPAGSTQTLIFRADIN